MIRSTVRRLVLVPAALAFGLVLTGCDSGDTTPDPPTTTPTPTITETFAGSIIVNGAATFTFPTNAAGTVTAVLRSITPDTLQVSLDLGTWNGVNCELRVTNPRASQGGNVTGSVTGAGTLCLRIGDIGQLAQPAGFEVVVTHP
jgi:hypothetical protein